MENGISLHYQCIYLYLYLFIFYSSIDGNNVYQSKSFEDVLNNNIYSIPYNSSTYSSGEHSLRIEITVNETKIFTSERIFTLNGDSKLFSASIGTFVLTFPLSSLTYFAFWVIVVFMWLIFPFFYYINHHLESKANKQFTPKVY